MAMRIVNIQKMDNYQRFWNGNDSPNFSYLDFQQRILDFLKCRNFHPHPSRCVWRISFKFLIEIKGIYLVSLENSLNFKDKVQAQIFKFQKKFLKNREQFIKYPRLKVSLKKMDLSAQKNVEIEKYDIAFPRVLYKSSSKSSL